MSATACSAASLTAGEPLAGTATEGARWLLVEVRAPWAREAVAGSSLSPAVRKVLEAFPGRVILIRRPDRRRGVTVVHATVTEQGGFAVRQEIESLEELPSADAGRGNPAEGPIMLVCGHGRRDRCCARLGRPLFGALSEHVSAEQLWQSSHLGGHRFAPNVLVLPLGAQLGRVPVERAGEVARLVAGGRVPVDLYRGRTIYVPPVQAAEVAVRSAARYDTLADLRLVDHDGGRVIFATPAGEIAVNVREEYGLAVPASCGADPEPTTSWSASIESTA